MKKLVFIVSCLVHIGASGLRFSEPVMGGAGCLPDSVSWALSPNNNSLSVLFGGFVTSFGRSSCELLTQVQVGNQTLVQADYRGFYDLPSNTTAITRLTLAVNERLIGARLDSNSGDEIAPYTRGEQINFSCAGNYMLRMMAEIVVQGLGSDRNASYTLDSIDLAASSQEDSPLRVCSSASHVGFWTSVFVSGLITLFSIWES